MRTAAALLFLLPGACSYTDPNPWDTSGDVEDYREFQEELWQYELREPFDHPQSDPEAHLDADLEAWRDTVLANADARTVKRMHAESRAKAAALKARLEVWYRTDPYNRRERVAPVAELYRKEMIRLKLIESRL